MEQSVPERSSHILRVRELSTQSATAFNLELDDNGRRGVADELGLSAVKKLRLSGQIEATGGQDWVLTADLGATVVQPCVVTLDPVTTRIDEPIKRTYLANMPAAEGVEVEMHDDDTIDEIPEEIDLQELLLEALSLSVPTFPRKDGVALGSAVYTEPGKEAMTDDDAKPFAGLGALKDAMNKKPN